MTKNFILGKLTPFQNRQNVITSRQGVNDIIYGLLQTHEQYKNEYDKISHFFYTGTEKGTAQKIWNYLKENVKYNIEPDSFQTLRSPAAILSIDDGADCKSYALFSNGILDSLRRKGLIKSDIAFRFAGYGYNNDLEHVFSVLKTNKGEIWIDPVLNEFDQKKEPNYYKDKNIKNMSLVAMAGIYDTTGVDPLAFDLGTPIDQTVIFDNTTPIDQTITPADQTQIIYTDPSTGVYQEQDGTFYLNDGTALNSYDPTTGVYQETDGTYYLQDGTPLDSYDPVHGVYQETDGTYYTLDGTALSFFDPSTGVYQEEGSSVFYDTNGNVINQSSIPTVPTRTNTVLSPSGSGGGGGFSPGGGGGGSKASNTALDKALTLLNKLFPSNAKPQTAPRSVIKKPIATTTKSNTNTYLMIGLGVAAIYLLTKKNK